MIFRRYDYAAFLGFIAYATGSLAIPIVLVQMADSLNFSLKEGGTAAGGWLHMIRALAICSTVLFSAYFASRWGNRRSLGVSVGLVGVGMALCACAPAYAWLLPALVIAGFGEGVIEALITPFIQQGHKDEDSGRYVNFSHGFWSLGVIIATIVFGCLILKGVHWRIVLGLAAIFCVPSTVLLLMKEGKHPYPERHERFDVKALILQVRDIAKVPRFWLYFAAMFLAGGGEFGLTFWLPSYVQLTFGETVMMAGIATAVFAGGMFAGRLGFGFLIPLHRLKRLVIITGIAATVICSILPFLKEPSIPLLLFILFLAGLGAASYWPSIQSYAVNRMPHHDSTMVFILLSCAGIPGCGVFTLLMGYLGKYGLNVSFFIVPACFLVMTLLLILDPRGITPPPKKI